MDRRQKQKKINEEEASRPSSRISRLAQPKRYPAEPHSLNKNRSTSTENVSRYSQKVNKRSRSTTPHIAMQTPVRPAIPRSLSSLFTPASTSKSVASRKHANDRTARILEVLRKHFGPTFLSSGLQSMTAKQFIEIIRFFARNICGDRIVIQDNNVDDVKRFVDSIEYPHQMNKSWFKAPTISIAYDRNVEFLEWLCDFLTIGDGDSISDEVHYKVAESDHLVDQQFSSRFFGDLRNGFVIWSDGTAEFDKWKFKWIREMITAKTGFDDIDASIERVKKEYESLQKEGSSFENEHLLKTQQNKCDELEVEVARMKFALDEKQIVFQKTTTEINEAASQNEKLTSEINEIKKTIKNQNVSADDRHRIIVNLDQKTYALQDKRAYIDSIKSITDGYQEKIARLKEGKTSKVLRLNTFIQNLFRIGISFGDLTIEQLSINGNDTKDEIKAKLKLLNGIEEIVNERLRSTNASMNEIRSELASISNELCVVDNKVAAHKKQLHSLETRIERIDKKITETKYYSEQRQQQLQMKINELVEENEQIILKIENAEKSTKTWRDENEKILQGIQLKTNVLLKAKQERQARQEAAISELEQVAEQVADAVKNLK